jgi:hypothetical protein
VVKILKIMLRLRPMTAAKAKYHALMVLSDIELPFQAKYKLIAKGAKTITYPKMPENNTGTRPSELISAAKIMVANTPLAMRLSTPATAVFRL